MIDFTAGEIHTAFFLFFPFGVFLLIFLDFPSCGWLVI